MAELTGMSAGISRAETDINKNVLTGLTAQKTLGEIAQQPADLALKQAHTRLYGAEAGVKEEAVATAARERRNLEEFVARKRLIDDKAASGGTATVADLPKSGRLAGRSGADTLIEYADHLAAIEGPSKTVVTLRDKIAEIQQREAAAASSRATEIKTQLETQEVFAGNLGRFAQGALAQPAQYQQIRMAAVQAGLLPELFPEQFNPALMRQYIDTSIKTKDKITLDRQELDSRAQRAKDFAAAGASSAAATTSAARTVVLQERGKMLKIDVERYEKEGGKYDPAVIASRKGLAELRAAQRDVAIKKAFPPVPLDPKARIFQQTYTAADGKTRFVWQKDPATGQGVARLLNPAEMLRIVPLAEAPAEAAKAQEKDDE